METQNCNGDTELHVAQTVDVMMAQAKRMYILVFKVNKWFSFFSLWHFLKEIHVENMSSMFLLSYRNTCESLGELEKLWKHLLRLVFPQHFSFSQTSTRVSIKNDLKISIA